jgi:hypothetical protein
MRILHGEALSRLCATHISLYSLRPAARLGYTPRRFRRRKVASAHTPAHRPCPSRRALAVVTSSLLQHTEPSAEAVRTSLLVLAHLAATQPHMATLSERTLKASAPAALWLWLS